MGKYTVIADVGKSIIDLLKDKLVPEPVSKPDTIGMCDPKERGSFVVGVHPYNFKENAEMRNLDPIVLPDGNLQNPSTSYQIFYMISIASKSEQTAKAEDEHRILGRIVQVLRDNAVIPKKYMPESLRLSNEEIKIEMLPLELEEKVKVWTMFSEPYKLSVFYSVGPLIIDSEVIKPPVKRVTSFGVGSRRIIQSREVDSQ